MNVQITATATVSNYRLRRNSDTVFQSADQELAQFLQAAYKALAVNYPKFYKMDTLSKLGWLAAEVLLRDFDRRDILPEEFAIVLANKHGSLDTDKKYYQTTSDIASPALFVYTLPNIVAGEICIRHNIKGETDFFISDRFDAEFLYQFVYNLFNNDTLQACICGWIDVLDENHTAVLALLTKSSFGRTGCLSMPFTANNLNKIFEEADG